MIFPYFTMFYVTCCYNIIFYFPVSTVSSLITNQSDVGHFPVLLDLSTITPPPALACAVSSSTTPDSPDEELIRKRAITIHEDVQNHL